MISENLLMNVATDSPTDLAREFVENVLEATLETGCGTCAALSFYGIMLPKRGEYMPRLMEKNDWMQAVAVSDLRCSPPQAARWRRS